VPLPNGLMSVRFTPLASTRPDYPAIVERVRDDPNPDRWVPAGMTASRTIALLRETGEFAEPAYRPDAFTWADGEETSAKCLTIELPAPDFEPV
jgi:hypothetical protein